MLVLDADRRDTTIRIREEKANIRDSDNMDISNDWGLLRCHVFWASLRDHCRHWAANSILQGSYCHRQCSESSQESTVYEIPQLVFPWNYDVLFVRGKRYILLQAYCPGRQGPVTLRYAPSIHKFHALCHW